MLAVTWAGLWRITHVICTNGAFSVLVINALGLFVVNAVGVLLHAIINGVHVVRLFGCALWDTRQAGTQVCVPACCECMPSGDFQQLLFTP